MSKTTIISESSFWFKVMPLVNIFSNYISSSVGLVTIDLTCTSNDDKKSVKIPEEATMYCKSKKDAANKVKIICYVHCCILIIIPSLNISLPYFLI